MSRERADILNAKKVLADLWPGQAQANSVALLKALHILTRDGALNHDARRKLKQVLHLVQLLRPSLDALLTEQPDAVIADLGTGKSYLGFILYDLVIGPLGRGSIVGVDVRAELVERSQQLAAESHFTRMKFVAGEIADTLLPEGRARHGHRPPCLRHRDRRCHPVCSAPRGQGHRAHPLLPGRGRNLAGSQHQPPGPALASQHPPAGIRRPRHQRYSLPCPGASRLQGARDGVHRSGALCSRTSSSSPRVTRRAIRSPAANSSNWWIGSA